VNAPVNFDDQFRLMAIEISDISTYRMLSSELQAAKLTVAETLPEHILGIRWVFAELATELKDIFWKSVFVAQHWGKILMMDAICTIQDIPSPPAPFPRGEGKSYFTTNFPKSYQSISSVLPLWE